MKQTVVIKVSMDGRKSFFGVTDGQEARVKAMKIAVGVPGVESASLKGEDKEQIEVKGDGIDTVKLAMLLRRKVGHADILSVMEEKKDEKKDEKKEDKKDEKQILPYYYTMVPSYPIYHYQEEPYSCQDPNTCSIV